MKSFCTSKLFATSKETSMIRRHRFLYTLLALVFINTNMVHARKTPRLPRSPVGSALACFRMGMSGPASRFSTRNPRGYR
jgi:hypothetical protein